MAGPCHACPGVMNPWNCRRWTDITTLIQKGREIPAYTTDAAVLQVPCTRRRFLSPWGRFPTIPEFFWPFFYSHGRNFPTMPEFSVHISIPRAGLYRLYIYTGKTPIPANGRDPGPTLCKKNQWVSVKIFLYLQRELSVISNDILWL